MKPHTFLHSGNEDPEALSHAYTGNMETVELQRNYMTLYRGGGSAGNRETWNHRQKKTLLAMCEVVCCRVVSYMMPAEQFKAFRCIFSRHIFKVYF